MEKRNHCTHCASLLAQTQSPTTSLRRNIRREQHQHQQQRPSNKVHRRQAYIQSCSSTKLANPNQMNNTHLQTQNPSSQAHSLLYPFSSIPSLHILQPPIMKEPNQISRHHAATTARHEMPTSKEKKKKKKTIHSLSISYFCFVYSKLVLLFPSLSFILSFPIIHSFASHSPFLSFTYHQHIFTKD